MFWACQRLTSKGMCAEGVGDGERGCERGCGGGPMAGGGFERDHGALHALAGGEAEDRGVEGDLVGGGAGEEGLDFSGVEVARPRWRGGGWR